MTIKKYQKSTLDFVFNSIVASDKSKPDMYGESEQDKKAEKEILIQEKNNYYK